MNLGARAEYRLIRQGDERVMRFVEGLLPHIQRARAIIKFPSAVIFQLKLERYKAIKYMAERLAQVPRYELGRPRYKDLALYLRYILLGTLSRPDDYSTTRDVVKQYNVMNNMLDFGLPIANWLTIHYLNLSHTNPFITRAQLPPSEADNETDNETDNEMDNKMDNESDNEMDNETDDESDDEADDSEPSRKRKHNANSVDIILDMSHPSPPANFGAPPYEIPLLDLPSTHVNRPHRQTHTRAINTRHLARQAQVPTPAQPPQQQPDEQQQPPEQQPDAQLAQLVNPAAPPRAPLADSALLIFAQYKFDFGEAIPSRDATCNVSAEHIALMEWTPANWRQVIMPQFNLRFMRPGNARLAWEGRFTICFGEEDNYSPLFGRIKSWKNTKYLEMLSVKYSSLDSAADKVNLRYELWKLFQTLITVPNSVMVDKMWQKDNKLGIKFVLQH
ncbi:hypothetical protein H4S00_004706 [Coemansia sp. D1744]|nr:hypothetical protein H4S00_004706 [Coemansia sp. D1744]